MNISADIQRALEGKLDKDKERRNLQMEAAAHVRVRFLKVSLDQISFMTGMFSLVQLGDRLEKYVIYSDELKPDTTSLLQEALIRREFPRGEAQRIMRLPERSARRILSEAIEQNPSLTVPIRSPACPTPVALQAGYFRTLKS